MWVGSTDQGQGQEQEGNRLEIGPEERPWRKEAMCSEWCQVKESVEVCSWR